MQLSRMRVASAAVVLLGIVQPSGAGAGELVTVEHRGCRGVQVVIPVPIANVEAVVPGAFTVARRAEPDGGSANVVVLAARCDDIVIDGTSTGVTTEAALRIDVNDPDQDATPAELFHHYQLWFASDNNKLVQHFQEHGGAGPHDAVLVDDFSYAHDPLSGSFRFVAPSPTPSPFVIDGVLRPALVPLAMTGDFWGSVPRGTMRADERVIGMFGLASGSITPEAGSELGRLFCDDADGTFRETGDSLRIALDNAYTVELRPHPPEPTR